MSKKTILITGSEGSLAQWVIPYLLPDYHVVGVDNFFRYGDISRQRDYAFRNGDLCNQQWLDEIFSMHKPDFVLHCAAHIYGVVGLHKYCADILGANSVSTYNVLRCCVNHDVEKISYVSSSMVYESSSQFPLTEDQVEGLPCPSTGYGFSKLVGEKMVTEFHKQYKLNYTIWRPFNIVTPLESSDSEPGIAHVFADFVQKIVLDKQVPLQILGNGEQTRTFTWIDDVAEFIALHSWQDYTNGEAYNLAGDTNVRILDLAQMIWKQAQRKEDFVAEFQKNYSDDVIKREPSTVKAQQLGWKHSKTIEQMVEICVGSANDL